MEAILENLVRSPKFPRYVDELNEFRERENVARACFRETLDEDVRAEFINGEVITHRSSRDRHALTVAYISQLVSLFVRLRRLGAVRTEQALIEFTRNDYVPDICFWHAEKSFQFVGETTIYPIPDFICEVLSPSTEERDRGVKFEDYAAHGVREYWIVDPDLKVIEQYFARSGRYELVAKFSEGIVRGIAIMGLEIPVRAAFEDRANIDAVRMLLGPQ